MPPNSRPLIIVPAVAGIGNAIMAVPMVRQLKRAMPDVHIAIAARLPAMGEIFARLSEVDEVIIMGGGGRGAARSMLALRRRRPEAMLTPFPSNRWQYAMLALASGARRRIMHAYPAGYLRAMAFVRADREPAVRGVHDVVQNLHLLHRLGIEPELSEAPQFILTAADRARADALLARIGLSPDARIIAIHPGSARTILARAKRWPAESYARLLGGIRATCSGEPVILEGPDEIGAGSQIARMAGASKPHILRLTGGLGDAAAVLERAALYVGSDSGLGHLAAAVGTPPVTLFAPADPDRICPFGYRDLVVQPGCSCCPCFMYPWEAPYPRMRHQELCIRRISVEAVMAAVARAAALKDACNSAVPR